MDSDTIEYPKTPSRGRPKGKSKKSKGFKGTPPSKKLSVVPVLDDIPQVVSDTSRPIGLVNIRNDCFFNSVVQTLFSLQSFRQHVRNFHTVIPDEVTAVSSIKHLFRVMESNSNNLIQTHDGIMALSFPGYIEHMQCDAEECMHE